MPLSSKTIKDFKQSLRDLADQELAIRSRRRQLLDILVADCGDDQEARRTARVVVYEIQRELRRKLAEDESEFLIEEEDTYDGSSPDDSGGD